MSAPSSVYNLTRLGRKVAGKVTPGARDQLLDYLYSNKNPSLEELQVASGLEKGRLMSLLSQYVSKGYVEKVGG